MRWKGKEKAGKGRKKRGRKGHRGEEGREGKRGPRKQPPQNLWSALVVMQVTKLKMSQQHLSSFSGKFARCIIYKVVIVAIKIYSVRPNAENVTALVPTSLI